MTRNFSILAAAATVAFLAFGGAGAFAMATNGNGSGHPGGPSGPTGPSNSHNELYIQSDCANHVDWTELVGGARRDYLRRCGQPNHGF